MTSEISAITDPSSCKPAIRLSLSNLAALLAVFTDPGMRRGALTLRDGTVIEVVSDEERYADARLSHFARHLARKRISSAHVDLCLQVLGESV